MRLNKYGLWCRVGCWVVVMGVVLLARPAQAQPGIATLKQQLSVAKADTTRSRLLCELGQQYLNSSIDSGLYFFDRSLQTARRSQDSVGMARAMYQLGFAHIYYTHNEAKALTWLNRAIAIAKPVNDNLHLARSYMLISIIANHQRIQNPIEVLNKARLYAQKADNRAVLADIYEMTAENFIMRKNLSEAERNTRRAMSITQQHDLDRWFNEGLSLGQVLQQQGKQTQATQVFQELDVVKGKLPRSQGYFVYMNSLAELEKKLHNYTEAGRILDEVLASEQAKAKPDTVHLTFIYENLIDLNVEQGNYRKAYELEIKRGNITLWLQAKRQTRDAKLQMTKQKAALDLEKKETQIALLDTQKQEQQVVLIGVGVVALLLVGFVWVLYSTRQRIEHQRTELSKLNATKDKLFAIISHDLRSPMAGLKNYLMLINWGALSPGEFDQSARTLSQQLNYLQTMLDNVLNWSMSQMEGMQSRPETVALAAVVEQELALLRPVAQAKAIALTDHIPAQAQLRVDKNHLAIILRNLLQNALKFTPAGGSVHIGYPPTPDGSSTIAVRDTGIGMDDAMQEELFQINKESSTGTANEPGTGLGLLLVKELVTVNGGQISVVSQVGIGTTFTLTFPNQPNALTRQTGKGVLITEDDLLN